MTSKFRRAHALPTCRAPVVALAHKQVSRDVLSARIRSRVGQRGQDDKDASHPSPRACTRAFSCQDKTFTLYKMDMNMEQRRSPAGASQDVYKPVTSFSVSLSYHLTVSMTQQIQRCACKRSGSSSIEVQVTQESHAIDLLAAQLQLQSCHNHSQLFAVRARTKMTAQCHIMCIGCTYHPYPFA